MTGQESPKAMPKKYKTGLIVGKFIPLHQGHQLLIETALRQCQKLIIIVCQNDNKNTIDPKIRVSWINELYPNIRTIIYHHRDVLDSISTDISPIWARLTVKLLGFAPDVVFSSEDYGKVYAKCMGSKHVLVDKKRKKIPISGTLIRTNPYQFWQYLSEPVRGYFSKRIVILGAESTGTTTLTQALARHYRTSWVPEYGRTYCEGRRTAKNCDNWTPDEFIHIAKIQNEMEAFLTRKSNKLLLCDTDAFATRLWFERYLGYLYPKLDKIVNTKNKSLYILTGDEIPFIQDGTRDGELIRHQMHQRFVEELNKNHLKYIIIKGSPSSRLKRAVAEIDKLFANDQ